MVNLNHARPRDLESLRGDLHRSLPRLLEPIRSRSRRRDPLPTVLPHAQLD